MASCESCKTQRIHFVLIYLLVGLAEETVSAFLYYMNVGANIGGVVAIGKLLESFLIGVFMPNVPQVLLTIVISILFESRAYCIINQHISHVEKKYTKSSHS